ncbi:MAG: hypothetical protein R3263_04645 [Myxococcota bacterium]|nr:hypothetical protein [Myxococcota bacterium]
MAHQDTVSLFTQYLNVVNAAVAAHKDETPYKQMIQAADKLAGDTRFGVEVYADDPGEPYESFTVRHDEGRLELVAHGKEDVDLDWKVSRDYLQKVVDDAQTYIDEPGRLDLDWLRSRLPL